MEEEGKCEEVLPPSITISSVSVRIEVCMKIRIYRVACLQNSDVPRDSHKGCFAMKLSSK